MDIVLGVVAVLAFLVSVITAWVSIGQWKVNRSQLEATRQTRRTENLLVLFQYLHQAEFRDARNVLRDPKVREVNDPAAKKVSSSFDFAGLFVRADLVDNDIFFWYWGDALRNLGDVLESFLETEQLKDLTGRQYWKDFAWLIEQAKSRAIPESRQTAAEGKYQQQKTTPTHQVI